MIIISAAASAAHEANVTLTPNITTCSEEGNTFNVSVENTPGSTDDIIQVEIYKALAGISNFSCGSAPFGWTLFSFIDRCIYVTELAGTEKIAPTETLNFTFDATMNSNACISNFTVVTVDDATPVGDRDTHLKGVSIDCTPPIVQKFVGDPAIPLTCDAKDINAQGGANLACNFWITDDTILSFSAQDNNTVLDVNKHIIQADGNLMCDTGLAYCQWKYDVDGSAPENWENECENNYGGIYENGWCKFSNGNTWQLSGIKFDEDSQHNIEVECFDNAGNSTSIEETDKVDQTDPETIKTLGEPKKVVGNIEWISTSTPITLAPNDPDPSGFSCNIGVDETKWVNILAPGGPILSQDDFCNYPELYCNSNYINTQDESLNWQDYTGSFTKDEESCHVLMYYSTDLIGNTQDINFNCFFVDDTPPAIVKEIGEPSSGDCPPGQEDLCYITSDTNITLHCTDTGPHPSGGEVAWYRYRYTEDGNTWSDWLPTLEDCEGPEYDTNGNWCDWNVQKKVHLPEDSLHQLQWYCEDAVGNKSEIDDEFIRVDNEPPTITKTMLGDANVDYLGDCPPAQNSNDVCYVADNGRGGVNVSVTDLGNPVHAANNVTCNYAMEWATDESTCLLHAGSWTGTTCVIDSGLFVEPDTNILFGEDSTHTLKIWCADSVGNTAYDEEVFLVDSTPPVSTKTFGPEGTFYIEEECEYQDGYEGEYQCEEKVKVEWIDTNTLIDINATDNKVGVDKTYYKVIGPVDDVVCETQCEAWQAYEEQTEDWNVYTGPFNGIGQSCHVLEYYSVDKLGNTEQTKYNCFFVDKTVPLVGKINGDEENIAIADSGEALFTNANNPDGNFHWVTSSTPITITCTDQLPHPSGVREVGFKVAYDQPAWPTDVTTDYCEGEVDESGYCIAQLQNDSFTFYFNEEEESMHSLEYYCIDNVGKESGVHKQYYKVDDTPPQFQKIISGPSYGDCSFAGTATPDSNCYVDTATSIDLNIVDGGAICAVGLDSEGCRWRYQVHEQGFSTDGNWSDWNSSFPIVFPEESYHTLEVACSDRLGNSTEGDIEYFVVDKTPPVTTKQFSEAGPYFSCVDWCEAGNKYEWQVENCVQQYCAEDVEGHWVPQWGTSDLNILLSAYDPQPHPSGVDETKFRISMVDDEFCGTGIQEEYEEPQVYCEDAIGNDLNGGWQTYTGAPFNVPEQSCHMIEYYSVDNVQKTEQTKKECIYIDNTGPEPGKTVGQPSTEWHPNVNWTPGNPVGDQPSAFYPYIDDGNLLNGECWSGSNSIDCWKVTLMTPVYMSCNDPEPHPVDHSKMFFMVGLDGDDATENYCNKVDYQHGVEANMTEDGWCEVNKDDLTFYFQEETEHNLKFYCEDALGNVGPIDDEKFKVEGDKFKIKLNKKWNLISVPFVLQDSNIVKVFKEVEDEIDSVWTFDAFTGQWYVYRPSSPGTSNLDSVDSGMGYWVLALDENVLAIGGALFSPITTPPSRSLKAGWNLIGYYGTDVLHSHPEAAKYYDGPDGHGRVAGCSLLSLKTSLTDLGWTSLETYWEPYNPNQWKFFEPDDRMDPGAGYWVLASKDGIYAYTSIDEGDCSLTDLD